MLRKYSENISAQYAQYQEIDFESVWIVFLESSMWSRAKSGVSAPRFLSWGMRKVRAVVVRQAAQSANQ